MAWAAIGGAAVGLIGNAVMGHKNSSAGASAGASASFHPTTVNGLLGGITGTKAPNGDLQYTQTLNPQTQGLADMFTNMSSGVGNYLDPQNMVNANNQATGVQQQVGGGLLNDATGATQLAGFLGGMVPSAGQNFNAAAGGALRSLGNFNPQAYAQNAYNQMSSLQNAYNTDQTQNMLNYEQSAGRGGLTQNGQLGDLGGIALAQGLTDNNLKTQAMQMGMQQQQLLGNQASQFAQTGSGQAQSALSNYLNALTGGANLATTGAGQFANAGNTQAGLFNNVLGGANNSLSGLLNLNSSLQNAMNSSINASQGQAVAGNNAANYGFQANMQNNNNTGNLIGGLVTGLSNNGAFNSFGNFMSGLTGGGGGGGSTPGYTAAQNAINTYGGTG